MISVSAVHPRKARLPTRVTEAGMVTEVINWHEASMASLISSSEAGSTTSVSSVPANACVPMRKILSGRLISSSVERQKAYSSMPSIDSGRMTFFMSHS